jgi:hypothetical protein
MRWAGNMAVLGESRNAYKFWWGNLKEKDQMHTRTEMGA